MKEDLFKVIKEKEKEKRKYEDYIRHIEIFDNLRKERRLYTEEAGKYDSVNTENTEKTGLTSSYCISASYDFFQTNLKFNQKMITLDDRVTNFFISSEEYVEILDRYIEKEYNWLKENE